MIELRPGLRRWTAFHPEWKEDVGSVAVDTSDGLVLIDPLVGDEEVPPPRHILITVHWHVRSTAELAGPEVRVWAPSRRGFPLRKRAEATDVFNPGDELPGGIQALPTAREGEVVFWLADYRALVFGDVILGKKGGGLRMCPQGWMRSATHADLAQSLKPLLDLPMELALVSHGEPVLENAREALSEAIGEEA